jgi:PH (Pleckstrin Homology) domain-containing protein
MSRTELALQSSGRKPAMSALLIVGIFLLGGVGLLIGLTLHPPADSKVVPLTVLFLAIMFLTPIPLFRMVSRRRAFVENGELVMVTSVGKKSISLAHLRARGLDVVDLHRRQDLVPRLRLWGASMPGLNAGWFKLRNGEKAFCIVTEQNRVSYLRSATDNVSVLLSLENPDALKTLLER